ncbi:MAG: alpha/beta hydrolase [Candidatus Thorarchaeota archaeon]|nr:alpha/beta hydrolase [Candidatus Thorarchaeota archaeon]
MLVEIALTTVVLVVILFLWSAINFRKWKMELQHTLDSNSRVITTSVGTIEYALVGEGPAIIAIHGAPGGYDQGIFAMRDWVDEGYSVLAISRPGYLKTPLNTGPSFEEQAEVIRALMDSLDVQKAAIIGSSAGGPVALVFSLQYPKRVWALGLICAVTLPYRAENNWLNNVVGRLFASDLLLDVGVWLFDVLTRYRTTYSLKRMFKENSTLNKFQIDERVKYVLSEPQQIVWYKEFIRTACPLTLRKDGLENDMEILRHVNLPNLETIITPTLILHGRADECSPFYTQNMLRHQYPMRNWSVLRMLGM